MPEALPYRHLYEVLLRFDGADKLRGAHAQYIEGYKVGDTIISAKLGDAIPLSLVDAADVESLTNSLGESNLALLFAKEAAEADSLAAKERATVAEAKEAEAVAKVEELTPLLARVAELEAIAK